MNPLFQALLAAIEEAARARGIDRFRIARKRNIHDELVIALIIDLGGGPLATIDSGHDDPRERKRQARMRR